MKYFSIFIVALCVTVLGIANGKIAQHCYKIRFVWPYPAIVLLTSEFYYIRFGLTKAFFIGVALILVYMFYAVSDILTRHVGDMLHIQIFILGCLLLRDQSLISMLAGFFALGLPMLIAALIKKGSVGGADIKFMAVSGWMFGWEKGLAVLLLGLFLSVIVTLIGATIKDKKILSIPLIPYFCVAGLIVYGVM